MKKYVFSISKIIFAIFFVILLNTETVKAFDENPKGPHFKFMEKLTEQLSEDQKNTIKEKVETLRKKGASREEIHLEVTTMLKEYGVEIHEDFKSFRGKRGHRPGRGFMHFSDELTNEQRAALRKKVKTMHDEGASREDIHNEIGSMLKIYGVDVPEDFHKHREMMEKLSGEQRKAVRVKMREMRKEGATPEEIRNEIHQMLQKFGISESDDQMNQSAESSGENLSIRSYPNPFNPETNIVMMK